MKMQTDMGNSENDQEQPAKSCRYSQQRLNQLAQPVKHRLYSKNKENIPPNDACKAPKARRKSVEDYDEPFLDRMEMMEKQRQEKLIRAAAEALYDASTDKKKCHNCGSTQSYDEMISGSDICQSDKCRNKKHSYKPPRSFSLKELQRSTERSSQRRSLVIDRIQEERRSSIVQTRQRRSLRQVELQEKVAKEGLDFNARMQKDIEARKSKIQHIEQTKMEILLSKEYTFKPKLKIAEHLIRTRKGGWDSLAAPQRRYTEEYQPPPSRAKKKKRRRMKPLESPWQSREVDDDKLRHKFRSKIM